MKDPAELRGLLAGFTGTDHWYRYWASKTLLYTDGVDAFLQHAGGGAFWFLDIVMTEPAILAAMRSEGIVFVLLRVLPDSSASIVVVRDSGEDPLFRRDITSTDCPVGDWNFYFSGNVLMLPREY